MGLTDLRRGLDQKIKATPKPTSLLTREVGGAARLEATLARRLTSPPSNTGGQFLDKDIPLGFPDYGTMLAYYVQRGKPTYRFFDYPPDRALVAHQFSSSILIAVIDFVYCWLHISLVPQSWYFVSRYVNRLGNADLPVPPGTGPLISVEEAQQKGFQYILIKSGPNLPPPQHLFQTLLVRTNLSVSDTIKKMMNDRLVQVSLGNNVPLEVPF